MTSMSDGWSVDVDGTGIIVRLSGRPDGAYRLTMHEARVMRAQLHLASLLAGRNQWATGEDPGGREPSGEMPTYSALTQDELNLREVEINDDVAAEALDRYKKYVERYLAETLEGASGDASGSSHSTFAAGEMPSSLPRGWRIAARGRSVEFVVPASADDGRFVIGIDEAIAAGVALIQQAERASMTQEDMTQEEGHRGVGGDE